MTNDDRGRTFHHPTTEPASTTPRPGWPEVLAGTVALVLAGALIPIARPLTAGMDPVAYGLLVAAWSGVAGLAGFTAAIMIRIRSWTVFGVRRTTWRWVAISLVAGVVAFFLKGVLNVILVAAVGFDTDPQGAYYDAAGGGVLAILGTFLFLAVLTPIGEEFFFRGVLLNALLRYGPVIGVLSSSAIFAVFHGVNLALPSAFVVGVVAAEVMRRSGSIWPAVLVHSVNNLGLPLLVLISGASSGN